MHERRVPIPDPCSVVWDEMGVLGRAGRYCEKCQHAVIDLSALTEAQAQRVLRTPNPDICVSYMREASGQIVFRKPALRDMNAGAAAVGALLSLAACSRSSSQQTPIAAELAPTAAVNQSLQLAETATPQGSSLPSIRVEVEQAVPTPTAIGAGPVEAQPSPGVASNSGKSSTSWPSAQQPVTDGEACDPPPKTPTHTSTGPKHPPPVRLRGKPMLHPRSDQ